MGNLLTILFSILKLLVMPEINRPLVLSCYCTYSQIQGHNLCAANPFCESCVGVAAKLCTSTEYRITVCTLT